MQKQPGWYLKGIESPRESIVEGKNEVHFGAAVSINPWFKKDSGELGPSNLAPKLRIIHYQG